jgi:membrane-associated protease RseP (regulator of RpoE activity)
MIAFIITSIILMMFHELSHVLTAKLINMKIDKIGFTMKPLPHIYVSAINVKASNWKNILFLMSGNAMTWLLFAIFMIYGSIFKVYYPVYIAFTIQLIFEMNPFFSDYTKLFCYYKYMKWLKTLFKEGRVLSYKKIEDKHLSIIQKYMYSSLWYVQFIGWVCIVIVLLSPRLLSSIIQ